jgi:hypothetical protein
MSAWSELQARDRLADHFIQTDPLEITLKRPVWSTTAAGGRSVTSTTTLGAQQFHIYPFKRRLTIEHTFNPQNFGEDKVEYITWVLMFKRSHNIEVDDYFDPSTDVVGGTDRLQSGLYTVTFISARLWDRGQAGVLYRG